MQNRNLVLFLTLSMAMLIGWNTFVVPRLLPPKKPVPTANAAKKDAGPASVAKAGQPDVHEKNAVGIDKTGDNEKARTPTTVAAVKGDGKAGPAGPDAIKTPAAAVAARTHRERFPNTSAKRSSWAAAIRTPDIFCRPS